MGFALEKYCTVEDFYNMPEDIRAELIDGEIVYRTSPSRIHQEILGELFNLIKNYMKSQREAAMYILRLLAYSSMKKRIPCWNRTFL